MAQKPGAQKRLTRQKKMGKTTEGEGRGLGSRTSLMGGGAPSGPQMPHRISSSISTRERRRIHFARNSSPYEKWWNIAHFYYARKFETLTALCWGSSGSGLGGYFPFDFSSVISYSDYSDGACCQDDGDLSFLFLLNYIYLLSFELHFSRLFCSKLVDLRWNWMKYFIIVFIIFLISDALPGS